MNISESQLPANLENRFYEYAVNVLDKPEGIDIKFDISKNKVTKVECFMKDKKLYKFTKKDIRESLDLN